MPLGPITIYDKSALQSLIADEAVWFGNFYRANITPIFFVETLADLEKQVALGRTPESVVGGLAAKSVLFGPDINVYHGTLCAAELLGHELEMRGVPVVSGGRSFRFGDRRGVLLDQPLEADALQRWQEGRFLDVERSFARVWRERLAGLNLDKGWRQLKGLGVGKLHVRDLAHAKSIVDGLVNADGWQGNALIAACESLSLPEPLVMQIVARWRRAGSPILPKFAPYTAHVLTVDMFFYLGLLSGSARLKVARFHRVRDGEPHVPDGQACGADGRGRGRPETAAPAIPSGDPAGKRCPAYAGVTFGAGRRWVSR